MERRDFIKTGLFAMLALYGFPEKVLGNRGDAARAAGRAGGKNYHLSGVYAGTIAENRVLMPEAFSLPLRDENLYLFAAKKYKSIFLIPEKSSEWKALEQIIHVMEKRDARHFRWRLAKFDKAGRLDLPGPLRKFAGIDKPTVKLTGQGNVIRIDDAEVPDP